MGYSDTVPSLYCHYTVTILFLYHYHAVVPHIVSIDPRIFPIGKIHREAFKIKGFDRCSTIIVV